ncbi:uncharacterized protein LOC129238030 [Anastrepha obliqua]|uniref:uncharacterized protein LOC129238030 n=1 Tax=Anastrepha obliqua TaxID=95512 RepID=UPI00240A4E22|nr:uncharacterized protein LOC129238030 [Anastrepha obliqua]
MDGLQDQKFNIRLVRTVKKYPILYNSDLKDYTRRDCRERAWIDVAEELNSDPKPLQKKWQNFRTIFVRKLKQIQMGESVQQYYLYDDLKFITPYLKKSYDPEGIESTVKKRKHKGYEEDDKHYDTDTDQSAEENAMINENDDNDDLIYLEEEDPVEVSSPKKIKISNSSEDEAEVCDIEDFTNRETEMRLNNSVSNKFITPTSSDGPKHSYLENNDNAKRQFVLSLLPDLSEMTNSQMRKFKCKVLLLVEKILEGNGT